METRSKYDGSVLHAPARLIAWVGGGRGAASDRERGETDRWKEGGGAQIHTRARTTRRITTPVDMLTKEKVIGYACIIIIIFQVKKLYPKADESPFEEVKCPICRLFFAPFFLLNFRNLTTVYKF